MYYFRQRYDNQQVKVYMSVSHEARQLSSSSSSLIYFLSSQNFINSQYRFIVFGWLPNLIDDAERARILQYLIENCLHSSV